jgi:hypothetical protein
MDSLLFPSLGFQILDRRHKRSTMGIGRNTLTRSNMIEFFLKFRPDFNRPYPTTTFIRQSLKRLRPFVSQKKGSLLCSCSSSYEIEMMYQPSSSLMFPSSQLSSHQAPSCRRYFRCTAIIMIPRSSMDITMERRNASTLPDCSGMESAPSSC